MLAAPSRSENWVWTWRWENCMNDQRKGHEVTCRKGVWRDQFSTIGCTEEFGHNFVQYLKQQNTLEDETHREVDGL